MFIVQLHRSSAAAFSTVRREGGWDLEIIGINLMKIGSKAHHFWMDWLAKHWSWGRWF